MYYSNDYLCHYGVLGMKWGQHLFGNRSASGSSAKSAKAAAKAQAEAERNAKNAKGKSMSTKAERRLDKALRVGDTATSAYLGAKTVHEIANKAFNGGIQVVTQHGINSGLSQGSAALKVIKAAELGLSSGPYVGTVALGMLAAAAVAGAASYDINKHYSNKKYEKMVDDAEKKS